MQFKIDKNQITRLDKELLTTENVNSVECSFSFSDDYNGLELYAVFYRDSTSNCFVALSNGKCTLPHELLESEGNLYIGAYGIKNTASSVEKRITTNAIAVKVLRSLSSSTSPAAAPTPDMWEQYKTIVLGYKTAAETAANNAFTYMSDALQYEQDAAYYGNLATNKATHATDAATAASNSATAAASSASTASTKANEASSSVASASASASAAATKATAAATSASTAETAATTAATKATEAASSATAASNSATTATQKAIAASDSAISATAAANTAAQQAAAASTAANSAEGFSTSAQTYAATAGTFAQNAETYKNQAQAVKDSTEINYDVQAKRVGFKRANESAYTYTQDLTGPSGSLITVNNISAGSDNNIALNSGNIPHGNTTVNAALSGLSTDLSTKQNEISTIGLLKGSGNGNISEAVSGTDYVAPSTISNMVTSVNQLSPNSGNVAITGSNIPASSVGNNTTISEAFGNIENSKQAKITASGILKGNGSGNVTAATAGTDYATTAIATTYTNGLMPYLDKYKLNNTTDYVVSNGTSGIWTWRKWNSGIAECWGTYYFLPSSFESAGNAIYYCDTGYNISLPFTFITLITCEASMKIFRNIDIVQGATNTSSNVTSLRAMLIQLANGAVNPSGYDINFNVKGTWK